MIRMDVLKSQDNTFDIARKRAIVMRDQVVVYDNKRPIMQFAGSTGDYNEYPILPLKTSLASMLVESVVDKSLYNSKRQRLSNHLTLGLLKGFETRGGKL